MSSHFDRKSLVNKRFIIWPKGKRILEGSTREIPRGHRPIVPAHVANQNAGFASS